MKGDGRHSFNEENGYVVLFVGTPYMDGRYAHEESAHVEVRGDFRVTDDIFWANHQDEIEQFEKDSSHIHWFRDGYKTEIRGGGPTGGGVAGSDYSW